MNRKSLSAIAASALLLLGGASASAATVATRAADVPDGMARISLEIHDIYGNGLMGAQLLLDADHNAFGELFFGAGSWFWGDYADFEYSIPEDAEAAKSTPTVVIDDKVDILVPAGIYDWMVVLPDAEALQISSGDYAVADDFELLPGFEYTVLVENRPNDWGFEEPYATLLVAHDLMVREVILPATSLALSDAEEIAVEIYNNGLSDESGFKASYSVNGEAPVAETISQTLKPGESLIHKFAKKADMSAPGNYMVTASVESDSDMLPGNNEASAKCRHLAPLNLPFEYSFADRDEESVLDDWTVVNVNGDWSTWTYNEWNKNRDDIYGVMNCSGNYSGDETDDDWLISAPLVMDAGMNHVILDLRCVNENTTEKVEVCYATTPDPADMVKCATFEVKSEEWRYQAANINLPADGIYYIGIHAVSVSGMNVYLASVSVGAGEFKGQPDIKLEKLLLPYSNCDLPSDSRIGMRISNNGLGALENYTLKAVVDGKTFKADLNDPINPDETRDIYLPDLFDFSEPDAYMVELSLTAEGINISDTALVECFEPLTDLPAVANFTNGDYEDVWTMLDPSGWIYEAYFSDFGSEKFGKEYGLLSHGATLSHDARFKISYAASGWGTSMHIYFGKASDDPMTYEEVYSEYDIPMSACEVEFDVKVAEPGNYSFLLTADGDPGMRCRLRLNEAVISEIMPFDACLVNVDAPVSGYLPASQTGCSGVHYATVTNRGSDTLHNIVASASINNGALSKSDAVASLEPGQTVVVPVEVTIPAFKAGDSFSIAYSISSAEEDGNLKDNVFETDAVTVTDTTRANENISEFQQTIGEYGTPLYVGTIYQIGSASDLTSLTIGLGETSDAIIANSEIAVSIYRTDGNTVGSRIYNTSFARGNGGFITIDLPDMRLEPGMYYFEVGQTSRNHMGLGWDVEKQAYCWQRNGNELSKVLAYAFCIRAEFAPGAVVYAKDAMPVRFVSPEVEEGLFRDNETVDVLVRNNGYEAASFDVALAVDGKPAGTTSVKLEAYEEQNVKFENVDLSAPGKHELECATTLSGDENAADDVCRITINSAEELDVYSFDFEGCTDFASGGDRLNPGWTTYDVNMLGLSYFVRYDYPKKGQPTGFVAFNLAGTTPSMVDTPLPGFAPHSGERFGVAFIYDRWGDGAEFADHADIRLQTPLLQMGTGSSITLFAKTRELETEWNKLEPFQIMVSETGDAPEDFQVLDDQTYRAPVEDWGEFNIDLSAFDGKKIRLAIRYVGVPGESTCLMIDDIAIQTNTTGITGISADSEAEYFTLDGIRVDHPAKGLYLKRVAGKTVKVMIR